MNHVALPPQRLNLISLCTGGGGLDLGIGLALPNAHPILLVEREAFAVAHLVAAIEQGLLAEAAIWSDVRTFDGRPFRGLVDGLIGGIPCQPHSLAGKRKGQDDERDLWSAARRIIVHARPWFVVIENVEGMLSSGGAVRVVGDLRKLGFTVEIGLFSATEAGASHQRNRVFIVAVADDDRGLGREGAGQGPSRYGLAEFGPADVSDDMADAATARRQDRENAGAGSRDAFGDRRRREEFERDGLDLANAICTGLERLGRDGRDSVQPGRFDARAERPVGAGSVSVVNASIERRREGRPEPEFRSGRDTAAGASLAMDDAADGEGSLYARRRRPDERAADAGGAGDLGLFPPGPSDIDRWRRVLEDSPHLEPAVRRMADGVAARLDLTGPHAARIERLRLLGNGVVCLEAAYAFRTLVSRLAASGSARAAQLVRLMEEA